MTICSNCGITMSDEREVFGHPSHPACLLCWLDPTPVDEAEEDLIWIDLSERSTMAVVPVPLMVDSCGECGGGLEVEVYEWDSVSRKPVEGGMWIRHQCLTTCAAAEWVNVEQWAIEHIRIMRSVPSPSVRIPGIKCPEIERRGDAPRKEVAP